MKLIKSEAKFDSISRYEILIIDIFAKLYAERIRNQVSKEQLSKKMGVAPNSITRLENLDQLPSLKVLIQYANGLGFNLKVDLIPIKKGELFRK